jgi:hypothetical protein
MIQVIAILAIGAFLGWFLQQDKIIIDLRGLWKK